MVAARISRSLCVALSNKLAVVRSTAHHHAKKIYDNILYYYFPIFWLRNNIIIVVVKRPRIPIVIYEWYFIFGIWIIFYNRRDDDQIRPVPMRWNTLRILCTLNLFIFIFIFDKQQSIIGTNTKYNNNRRCDPVIPLRRLNCLHIKYFCTSWKFADVDCSLCMSVVYFLFTILLYCVLQSLENKNCFFHLNIILF